MEEQEDHSFRAGPDVEEEVDHSFQDWGYVGGGNDDTQSGNEKGSDDGLTFAYSVLVNHSHAGTYCHICEEEIEGLTSLNMLQRIMTKKLASSTNTKVPTLRVTMCTKAQGKWETTTL